MKVILSIRPEFVERIFSGIKRFEYRKVIFKRNDISTVVVYATKPYGKVVGEFEIGDIIMNNPKELWKQTKGYSGISKSYFNEYFEGRDQGFAIKIKSCKKYDKPLDLSAYDNSIKVAPQSFCYTEV
ncbi:MAG: ASCH domain-containing protein [Vulcanibacillus sp.]